MKLSIIMEQEWTKNNTTQYNNLNLHITHCVHRAELMCSSLGRSRGYLWSTDLALSGSQLLYWNTLKQTFGKWRNISQDTMTRQREMAEIPEHKQMDLAAVLKEVKNAERVIKYFQEERHNVQLRKDHLERLVAALDISKHRDREKTNTIRWLIKDEEQRQMFKRCQQQFCRTRNGLSGILVPTNPQEATYSDVKEWKKRKRQRKGHFYCITRP
jgi:hypothetical protein